MFYGLQQEALTLHGMAHMSFSQPWTDLDEYLWLRRGTVRRMAWLPEELEDAFRLYGYREDWRVRA